VVLSCIWLSTRRVLVLERDANDGNAAGGEKQLRVGDSKELEESDEMSGERRGGGRESQRSDWGVESTHKQKIDRAGPGGRSRSEVVERADWEISKRNFATLDVVVKGGGPKKGSIQMSIAGQVASIIQSPPGA
jgi:hypothetical protein